MTWTKVASCRRRRRRRDYALCRMLTLPAQKFLSDRAEQYEPPDPHYEYSEDANGRKIKKKVSFGVLAFGREARCGLKSGNGGSFLRRTRPPLTTRAAPRAARLVQKGSTDSEEDSEARASLG